jgi:hypothetical protein
LKPSILVSTQSTWNGLCSSESRPCALCESRICKWCIALSRWMDQASHHCRGSAQTWSENDKLSLDFHHLPFSEFCIIDQKFPLDFDLLRLAGNHLVW